MYKVFRSEWYEEKLKKLDKSCFGRVLKFEQALKLSPYSGKPLGYEFLREKKFDGKRLIFLVYEEHETIFLITISDKKDQRKDITFIKANREKYREELNTKIKFLLFFLLRYH